MWTFIDVNTGNAFNGEAPYIFWFDDGQSTNLNYVKQICVYSDTQYIDIVCKSEIFSILKMDQLIPQHEQIIMSGKQFIDLEELKTDSWRSEGYLYKDNYVHMLYFLAHSVDAGEFSDTFDLLDIKNGIKHTYAIGADFYQENELLKSNLENFELKIPESIQRAIYETNIHEESNDNILLNRKYKELLMNYWDIVANKGSYNSLINSLKWFEWGDLVSIQEIWKMKEPHGDTFKLKDIKTQLTHELLKQLDSISKTTYIGLYYALYKMERNEHGRVVYHDTYNRDPELITNRIHENEALTILPRDERFSIVQMGEYADSDARLVQTGAKRIDHLDKITLNEFINEEIPQLEHVKSIWNNLDLCLKITLLGNFYQTFFMPIHLDLLHSTICSEVFANVIKLINGSEQSRFDYVSCVNTFDLNYEYE